MTRPELAAAIRGLRDDEKLELLSELWDSLEDDGEVPEWHKAELDARLDEESPVTTEWSVVKARILGTK